MITCSVQDAAQCYDYEEIELLYSSSIEFYDLLCLPANGLMVEGNSFVVP